jgi:Homeodomain-like domain
MDKYRVTLTAEERADLEHLVSSGKGAARRLTHARILLLADAAVSGGHTDEQIVAALGVGICTVGRVRRRLVTAGLPAALDPRPQPQRPDKIKIKGDVEQRLIQLACSEPPAGRCQWPPDEGGGRLPRRPQGECTACACAGAAGGYRRTAPGHGCWPARGGSGRVTR